MRLVDNRISIFRYVRHHDVEDYLRAGWHIAQVDIGHHGYYSVLLYWMCQCPVADPANRSGGKPMEDRHGTGRGKAPPSMALGGSMSWTIVDDNGVLQVRASLATPEESLDLIQALTERYTTHDFAQPPAPLGGQLPVTAVPNVQPGDA